MKKRKKKKKRNDISTIFSQQILNGKLLLVIIGRQKINFSCEFKLQSNNLRPRICCKNVVDVTFLKKKKNATYTKIS